MAIQQSIYQQVLERERAEREQWHRDQIAARSSQQFVLIAVSARRYRVMQFVSVAQHGGIGGDFVQTWEFCTEPLLYSEALAEVKRLNKGEAR